MFSKLIAARQHFICLLNGEFENRKFSICVAGSLPIIILETLGSLNPRLKLQI